MPHSLQTKHRFSFALRLLPGLFVVAGIFLFPGCNHEDKPLPLPPPNRYNEMVSAFYTGTVGIIVQDPNRPEPNLKRATEIVPEEPAAWANLGLYYLRAPNQIEEAKRCLLRAQSLAPSRTEIEALLGHLENKQGHVPEAIVHFRKSVELDSKNLFARYILAQLIDRQRDPNYESDYQQQMEGILAVQPHNIQALLELARVAVQRKDADVLRKAVTGLDAESKAWPARAQEAMANLKTVAAGTDFTAANGGILRLTNLVKDQAIFQRSVAALKPPDNAIGIPLERFLRLPNPSAEAAAPDTALTFTDKPLPGLDRQKVALASYVSLAPEISDELGKTFQYKAGAEGVGSLLLADGRSVRIIINGKTTTLAFPGGSAGTPPSHEGVLPVDLDFDFRLDLVLAGAGGLRFYMQNPDGSFRDTTARTKLPAAILNAPCYGVWAADVDSDGDLDLIVGTTDGPTQILRNNGDGTFKPLDTFVEVRQARGFLWADIDGDGDPDAALLDAQGKVHILMNERSGRFTNRPLPPEVKTVAAMGAGDMNRDGLLDFVLLQTDGTLLRLSDTTGGGAWETAELARWQGFSGDASGGSHLFIADLDNNGGLDVAASSPTGNQIWLGDSKAVLQPVAAPSGVQICAVADIPDGDKLETRPDGKLDLLALSADGKPMRWLNQSQKNYKWVDVRPRATLVRDKSGDSRINAFGIGGEIEARSWLLVQKQLITGPTVHFGLGENLKADYARFVWPNGGVQGEFELQSSQQVVAIQRLKGSCPWLFAWDGQKMAFVTDFIWRSPLGLRINAQATAGVMTTEDWVKIRGDQLVPKDGFYDLRITADLWETHFFDHLSLMVVDHPADTEVFVDERFAIPPPAFKVYAVEKPRPILRAVDDNGTDVTRIVQARDANYLDTFGRGQYQGVTRDHFVEIELPREAVSRKPVYLVANGWIHPTDSSINVAISQGGHAPPKSLQLEIPDGKGGWKVARPNLGFPSGKTKTVLLDLTGIFGPASASSVRLRLRTNLEIYWDSIQWAVGRPETNLKTQRLSLQTADLRYRGFSATQQANASSPELPDYAVIQTQKQMWRDLVGYYTRFGEVRELLQKVDDRYVIMNAGDEMVLRFAAQAPPSSGMVRDYVFIGDGWVKDGDYNTTASKTVLPLPSHSNPNYSASPGRLEDDPVYRRHADDWRNYHTRYVTPEAFRNALRPRLAD